MNTDRRRRAEVGVAQIVVIFGLIALVAIVALAVDNGFMHGTHAQLQNAADAAALAALGELQTGGTVDDAAAKAIQVAQDHRAGDAEVLLDPESDVVFGGFDYATRTFTTGGLFATSAVRITARRTSDSPAGSLSLLLAPIIGKESAQLSASAVASFGQRDIVIVQDVTYSFREEVGPPPVDPENPGQSAQPARDALRTFTDAMAANSLAGDRLGLVTFAEEAEIEAPLSEMPSRAGELLNAIDTFERCVREAEDADLVYPCRGTSTVTGIEAAIEVFEEADSRLAERIVLLVHDGVPCVVDDDAATELQKQLALAAAQTAEAEGISIFSVFFDNPAPGGVYCHGTDEDAESAEQFARGVATGFGKFFATPDAEDLDDILLSTLRAMPLRLVQ